jgi:hypothetical protein
MLKLGKLNKGGGGALPRLPANPLQAQLKYKDESTRYIKLYGSGSMNLESLLNSDMGVFIEVIVSHLLFH